MFWKFFCAPQPSLREQVEGLRILINQLGANMATSLENLQQEVTENNNAVQSAITLLNGLKQKLDEAIDANNNGDSTKLDELSASLDTSTNALAAAVAANTPAEEEPPAPAPSPAPSA